MPHRLVALDSLSKTTMDNTMNMGQATASQGAHFRRISASPKRAATTHDPHSEITKSWAHEITRTSAGKKTIANVATRHIGRSSVFVLWGGATFGLCSRTASRTNRGSMPASLAACSKSESLVLKPSWRCSSAAQAMTAARSLSLKAGSIFSVEVRSVSKMPRGLHVTSCRWVARSHQRLDS